jgi:hypothetical protein
MGEKAQKYLALAGAKAVRIPLKLHGSLSRPRVSVTKGYMFEQILKDIFYKKEESAIEKLFNDMLKGKKKNSEGE